MPQEFKSSHAAMATEFSLTIRHRDAAIAQEATRAVWGEIDRLEDMLSCFRQGSDICLINHCDAGVTVPLREETDMCLRLAVRVMEATQGVFDVGVGALTDALKKSAGEAALKSAFEAKTRGGLMLHEESPHITVLEPGVQLDLGSIGKGFAVDWVQSILADFGVDSYLLSSGGSSIWANTPSDDEYWNVRLAGDKRSYFLHAQQCAVSVSGAGVNSANIVNPLMGTRRQLHRRCWAVCQSAAIAEALSTAALLLPPADISRALEHLGETAAVIIEPADPEQSWEFISYPEGSLVPKNAEDPESPWRLRQ